MQSRAVQPGTGRILVDLNNLPGRAERIFFGRRADGRFEKRWWRIELGTSGMVAT